MPTQSNPYLVLCDSSGSPAVTFSDGAGGVTNYNPVRGAWAPNVAGLRKSLLGGRLPYEDVIEDVTINIRDTTAAGALSKLDTLTRLLDQADRRWQRNEAVNAVQLRYVPQGSTLHASGGTYLNALVIGRPPGDISSGIALPVVFNDVGMFYEIRGVRVRVLRRGGWTGTVDSTGASGSSANAAVLTQTFGTTHALNSPLDVEIGGFDKVTTPTIKAGYLCVGSSVNDIQVLEAESGTATAYTSVGDSGNLARGNNVLRYTPTDTNPKTSGTLTLTSIGGPVAIIAAVRNNSGTTTWQIQANLSGLAGAVSTPIQPIDASSTTPRLLMLGTVVGTALTKVSLTITASAASGTLDIDFLIVVNLRNETCAVLAHDDISLANLSNGAVTLDAIFLPYTDKQPSFYAAGSGGSVPGTYRGSLPFLTTGTTVYALWTAPNGVYWRFTNTSNALVNVTLNVSRYRQYLTPQ